MIVKAVLDDILPALEEKVLKFPWEDPQSYAKWMSAQFQYTSHSVPLLKYAADRMRDPVMLAEMKIHIDGEAGHEKLAFNDLRSLGYEPFPETNAIKYLYSVVYQWIDEDPIYIFSYSTPLEYLSARIVPEIVSRLTKAHGEKHARFMRVHANVDQEHTAAAWETLMHFTEEQQLKIASKCHLTVENFSNYTEDIMKRSLVAKKVA